MSAIISETRVLRRPLLVVPEFVGWWAKYFINCVHGLRWGLAVMRRYDALANLSDAELKRRGISRDEIARLAVLAAEEV